MAAKTMARGATLTRQYVSGYLLRKAADARREGHWEVARALEQAATWLKGQPARTKKRPGGLGAR